MTRTAPTSCFVLLAAAMTWVAPDACAAGGHFDVDDAAVLEPGQCQYEAWAARAPGAASTLLHLGPGCRVGPVELGLNIDRVSRPGDRQTVLGPQLKWVAEPWAGVLSIGAVGSALFDVGRGGRPSLSLYAPLTLTVTPAVSVNVNVGVDRGSDGSRSGRHGLSAEWGWNHRFTLIGERARVAGEWVSRLGARWSIDESISIDLGAARIGPQAERVFTIGLNHTLAR